MHRMRTAFLGLAGAAGAATAVLAIAGPAPADMAEVGTDVPESPPSCPEKPCLAVSRTTGYQAKVGTNRGLMTVKADGRIVSWTLALGNPGKKQIDFFDDKLGGEAQAQITVLRPAGKLRYRVVSHGEPIKLRPYFGTKAEFALERTLRVRKGWVVGVTVPTWAPALAVNLGGDTSWRAARAKGQCEDTGTQTASRPGTTPQFYCLYRTARLTYSARIITNPAPASATTTTKTTTTTG